MPATPMLAGLNPRADSQRNAPSAGTKLIAALQSRRQESNGVRPGHRLS